MIQSLGKHYGFDVNTPFEGLPGKIPKVVLHGSGKEVINSAIYPSAGTTFNREHAV